SRLDALAARARLLAPDLAGLGLSAVPTTAPSLDDYARQVIAVLDTLAVSRVVVVGLSMGGYLAFRLLTELGPRLAGLVLADTRATPDTEAGAPRRHPPAAEVEGCGGHLHAHGFRPVCPGASTLRTLACRDLC